MKVEADVDSAGSFGGSGFGTDGVVHAGEEVEEKNR